MNADSMAGRRSDPNYSQISAYIPKELAIEFKVALTRNELSQIEALEMAVILFLEALESGQPLPKVQEWSDKRRKADQGGK